MADKITYYPRTVRMRNLVKGYALLNEMRDTELIDRALKSYFEGLKIDEDYRQRCMNTGRHHYMALGRKV